MRKKTPIRIDDLCFTDVSTARINEIRKNLSRLDFDDRLDFPITKDFAGIAIRLSIFNKRHNEFKGTRRRLSLTLIDTTSRVVMASKQIKLYIAGGEMMKLAYADFFLGQEEFESEHAYKVVVKDDLASIMLGEYSFHLNSDADEFDYEDFEAFLNSFVTSNISEEMEAEESEDLDESLVADPFEDPEEADEAGEMGYAEEAEEESKDGVSDEEVQAEELSLAQELDQLTGLREVKEKLLVYEKVVNFCSLRRRMNLPVFPTPLHAMFLGSPGTGKTTVAMLMGKMLKKAGLLSSGHVVVRERSTLLGQNYNSESEKTLDAINEAQGGILLIDEAYQLFQKNDPKDPGKFVIETLLTALSDPTKNDWMLILAGYSDEMRSLFEMNPGFKSRIPEANIYTFSDFTEDELMEIAENYLKNLRFNLTDEARGALSRRLSSDYAQRDRRFGNARHVRNLIETEILPAMAVRVMNEGTSDLESLREIRLPDIPQPRAVRCERQSYVGFHCSKAI